MHTIVWPEQHTARVKALLQVHLCSLCDAGPARNILHHRRSLKPLVAQAIEKSERITCFLGQPDIIARLTMPEPSLPVIWRSVIFG